MSSILVNLVNSCAMPFGSLDLTCNNCICCNCIERCHNVYHVYTAPNNSNVRGTNATQPDIIRGRGNLTKSASLQNTHEIKEKINKLTISRSVISLPNLEHAPRIRLPNSNETCEFNNELNSSGDVVDGVMSASHQDLTKIAEEDEAAFSKDISPPVSPSHKRSFSFPVEMTSSYKPDIYSDLIKTKLETKTVPSSSNNVSCSSNNIISPSANVEIKSVDHINAIQRKLRTDASYLLASNEVASNVVDENRLQSLLLEERSKHPMTWELPSSPPPPPVEQAEEKRSDETTNFDDLIRIGLELRTIADNYSQSQSFKQEDSDIFARVFAQSVPTAIGKVLGVSLLALVCWKLGNRQL